jgi:hypothetical protein
MAVIPFRSADDDDDDASDQQQQQPGSQQGGQWPVAEESRVAFGGLDGLDQSQTETPRDERRDDRGW